MNDRQRAALIKHLEKMSKGPNSGDKRKHPREDCSINVDMRTQDPQLNSCILDINQYGAYIETNQSFSAGQQIRLTFASPDSRKSLSISGQVTRRDDRGVGVKFKNLTKYELKTFRSFVNTHDGAYGEKNTAEAAT
jgi:hypothetical protein